MNKSIIFIIRAFSSVGHLTLNLPMDFQKMLIPHSKTPDQNA